MHRSADGVMMVMAVLEVRRIADVEGKVRPRASRLESSVQSSSLLAWRPVCQSARHEEHEPSSDVNAHSQAQQQQAFVE